MGFSPGRFERYGSDSDRKVRAREAFSKGSPAYFVGRFRFDVFGPIEGWEAGTMLSRTPWVRRLPPAHISRKPQAPIVLVTKSPAICLLFGAPPAVPAEVHIGIQTYVPEEGLEVLLDCYIFKK